MVNSNGGNFSISGENLKGLSFDQILGAVVGHEVKHATKENEAAKAKKKDFEAPAHKVSKDILQEEKANNEKKKTN